MDLDASSCERYLKWACGDTTRLVEVTRLQGSSRQAPWRVTAEVEGGRVSYVLRAGVRSLDREYHVLKAMERLSIPTPKALGWEPTGEQLGMPGFLVELIRGETLLAPLIAGESWAEDLYLEAVRSLQAISMNDLPGLEYHLGSELTARTVLEKAHKELSGSSDTLVDSVYGRLCQSAPTSPAPLFSNGDLWPENFIIRDRQLAGIIDFENAGFSDPIYEFLIASFVQPELRGRGMERRYCALMGFDGDLLPRYRALERFATLAYVVRSKQSFVHHTEASLRHELEGWLAGNEL